MQTKNKGVMTRYFRADQDKTAPSSHLSVQHDGMVEYRDGQVVESTCKMHVMVFPFDAQVCCISFKSIMHSGKHS